MTLEKWKKPASRVLYVAFVIALVELSCCVYLKVRIVDPLPDGWAHIYSRYRTWELNPDYHSDFRTKGKKIHSPDGFREDKAVEKKKPEGTFRVIAMGASVLYGLGSDGTQDYPYTPALMNDATIDYFLEQMVNEELAKRGVSKKVEIINAAVSGYHTFHHLIYLNEVLWEYEPDLVIFLDGHNDFYFTQPRNDWRAAAEGQEHVRRGLNQQTLSFTAQMGVRFLARYSNFFAAIESVVRLRTGGITADVPRPKDAEDVTTPAWKERVAKVMQQNFLRAYTQINALGKNAGFEVLVFLQPEIEYEDPDSLGPAEKHIFDLRIKHVAPSAPQAMRIIRSMLPDAFRGIGVPFSDMSTIATKPPSEAQLYVDYCHLSKDGSRVLAAKMTGPLVEKIVETLKAKGGSQGG